MVYKEHASRYPWIRSEKPKETRIWLLWTLYGLTKDVEETPTFSILSYMALADPMRWIQKPNHTQSQSLINKHVEKEH